MIGKIKIYCLSKTHHTLRERFILINMELRKIFEYFVNIGLSTLPGYQIRIVNEI